MSSQHQNEQHKQDEDFIDFISDSDDGRNGKYNNNLIHVIHDYGSSKSSNKSSNRSSNRSSNGNSNSNSNPNPNPNPTPNPAHIPSSKISSLPKQQSSTMRLDYIVSTLFDMKSYIKNQSKVTEFERLIDLLLDKFNTMQSEKFNLLQIIHNLEKENDRLYAQNNDKNNDNDNDNFDEFKEIDNSVILVDYYADNSDNDGIMDNDNNSSHKTIKTSIAPWTKYYSRHKTGIGEDLRIAIISSQKLKDVKTYNDQYFDEALQSIEIKCYFPKLFKSLREIYGISLQDFLSSFKANNLLEINQCQSSLSRSLFFYSFDGKYIIKSMRREEVIFIKQMIYKYYKHIEANKNKSFMTKFIAMFKIINTNDNIINAQINRVNKAQHFMIMNCIYYDNDININNDNKPLLIYDLKGSKYNRITEKQNNYQFQFKALNKNNISILKDYEWMDKGIKLDLSENEAQKIKKQLFKDIQFLKSLEIMDYSLLIALYDDKNNKNNKNKYHKKKGNKKHQKYFIGIIDFLQHWNYWKQIEGNGAYYILGIDGYDIVDPEQYANRLWKFICDFVV